MRRDGYMCIELPIKTNATRNTKAKGVFSHVAPVVQYTFVKKRRVNINDQKTQSEADAA